MMTATGPKISSCAIRISFVTSVISVGLHEAAVFTAVFFELLSAAQDFGAFRFRDIDIAQNFIYLTHIDL